MSRIAEYLSRKLAKLFKKIIVKSMGDPFITFGEIAIKNGTCCICGMRLHDPNVKEGHFSCVPIYKKATWNGPVATLTNKTGQSLDNLALAIICAECENISQGNTTWIQNSVKFAVELDMRRNNFVYHDVKKLEDYPLVIEG